MLRLCECRIQVSKRLQIQVCVRDQDMLVAAALQPKANHEVCVQSSIAWSWEQLSSKTCKATGRKLGNQPLLNVDLGAQGSVDGSTKIHQDTKIHQNTTESQNEVSIQEAHAEHILPSCKVQIPTHAETTRMAVCESKGC